MTTIYLIRHSHARPKIEYLRSNKNYQKQIDERILTVIGEKRASKLSEKENFKSIDAVYSSSFSRTMSTAKYISEKNNLPILIDERFGELDFGIVDEITKAEELELFRKIYEEEEFTYQNGESQKQAKKRIVDAFYETIDENANKNIVIVSHGLILTFLLKEWCEVVYLGDYNRIISFNNKKIFEGKFEAPEVFKLTFEGKELIDIENIKVEY